MDNYVEAVGKKIKEYRKAQGMTLQELADAIHKSRASVSKYECGSITIDVETLHDISRVLNVSLFQLTEVEDKVPEQNLRWASMQSPFFEAKKLYFYYYDGRFKKLKSGTIEVSPEPSETGYKANLYINSPGSGGRTNRSYYVGTVVYSDMIIRFSFVNKYNPLEEDLLYIFNPLELRDVTEGLLCGISSVDFMPCAYKCLVSVVPQQQTKDLEERLLITKKEMQYWKKLNIFVVDNSID